MKPFYLCRCGCGEWCQGTYRRGHNQKGLLPKRYAVEWNGRRLMLAHRVRAERALGKALPSGALVHHADGSKNEYAPLVICPSHAYHALLHARMRVIAAGGNPNTDRICAKCRQVWARTEFAASGKGYCRPCGAEYAAKRRTTALDSLI